jgi:AraC-like ligand binding domain
MLTLKLLFRWLAATASCAALWNVQTPEPRTVSVINEPHHRLLFENSYVRVFRENLDGREATLLHRHDRPYVYVTLGPADFINAEPDKPDVHVMMSTGQVAYSRGGFSHIVRTNGGSRLEDITIELLKTQSEPQNTCGQIVPGPSIYFSCPKMSAEEKTGSSTLALFKTDETDVSLQWLGRNTSQSGITYQLGTLMVILSGSGLHTTVKGEPDQALSPGGVLWLLAEAPVFITNESGKPWSYLSLSFEGTEPFNPQWKPRHFVSARSPD